MAFDFGSGFGDIGDLSTITDGADMATPLHDVSDGSQDMQSYTPTGNGSGEWVGFSDKTTDRLWGGLDKVLNYALIRDNMQMQRVPTASQQIQQGTLAVQRQQSNNSGLLLWIALGAGVFMLASR